MRSRNGNPRRGPLATVTHAKLRAAQGDAAAAREILQAILEAYPGDEEARAVLARLEGERDRPVPVEEEDSVGPPQTEDPAALAARFRKTLRGRGEEKGGSGVILRFEALLERIARQRGRGHAR
jgi:hypothetical protein